MSPSPRILIVGSGPGALEAALALGASESITAEIDLISPQTEFVYRPNLVLEPFGGQPPARYSVGELLEGSGARQWQGTIESVDPAAGLARSPEGDEFNFDALILATGAVPRAALPQPAITVGTNGSLDQLGDLVADIDAGRLSTLGFLRQPGATWSLPTYELALLAAARAGRQVARQLDVGVITHEPSPLIDFGQDNSDRVAALCAEAGVVLHCQSELLSYEGRTAVLADGQQLEIDRLVVMPQLEAVVPDGVPTSENGFVAVDQSQLVAGTENIYAIGDVTDFPFKQGGLAGAEADAAVSAIAARLGSGGNPVPFDGEVRGVLLAADQRLILRARVTASGAESLPVEDSSQPLPKIDGALLSARIAAVSPLA